MRFLKLIGAVSAAEHKSKVHTLEEIMSNMDDDFGKLEAERDELSDKFKLAISDLAAQADQITALIGERTDLAEDLAIANNEIAALRPDAEKWRDRAARELQRGQAKRDAAAKKGAGK